MHNLVTVLYVNHRGEEAHRNILPIRLWYGSTAWHPETQWMLECFDLGRQSVRDYTLAGIKSWVRYVPPETTI